MRPWRVIVPFVVACLVPLLVSWGCAVFAPLGPPLGGFPGFIWLFPPPFEQTPPDRMIAGPQGVGVVWRAASVDLETVMEASKLPCSRRDPDAAIGEYAQLEMRAGWPWPAFAARIEGERPPTGTPFVPLAFARTWAGGLRLAQTRVDAGVLPGATELGLALPLVPLWPGLAYELAIALGVVMPLPLVLELRRAARIRQRRCVRCGHPILPAQALCPECGSSPVAV